MADMTTEINIKKIAVEEYGAHRNSELAGVIASRNGSHIALFFVKGKYHRQGIGKALFGALLCDIGEQPLTVNSSPYAQKVYERLGFVQTGAEQSIDGVRFIPMRRELQP